MKTIRDHLSVSQIRKYLNCGMQYYYSYVEGIRSAPTGSMIRGLSVDTAANNHFSKKIEKCKENFNSAAEAISSLLERTYYK